MNETTITSPLKAIRAKCLDCCCGQIGEIKSCVVSSCPLHDFRFGKNPHRIKREYTEEQLSDMRERLERARKLKNH